MAAKSKQHVVVVDGSNLATEGRTLPSLKQLDEAVRAYAEEDPEAEIVVVVDASFEHRIDASERAQLVEAELHGEVVSPPAGAIGRGDAFVLRIAERTGARVLSNDSFQEFHAEHPWLFDEGRLVGGKPVPGIGWIFTPRLPVRGPKSRQVTGKARRAAETLSPPVKAAELAKAAKKAAARKVPALPPGVTPKVGDVWTALAAGNGHEPPAPDDGSSDHPVEGPRGGTRTAKRAAAEQAPAAPAKKAGAKKAVAKKAGAGKAATASDATENAAAEAGRGQPGAEKTVGKKSAAKKSAAKKSAAKKSAATKTAATKTASKKSAPATATARKAVKEAAATAGGASEAAAPLAPDAIGDAVSDGSVAEGLQPAEPVAKKAASTKAAATKATVKKASTTKASATKTTAKKTSAKKTAAEQPAAKTSSAPEDARALRATAKAAPSKKAAAVNSASTTSAGLTRTARADPAVRVAIDEAMAEVLAPPQPATDGKSTKKSGSKKSKDHDVKDASKAKRRRRRPGGPPPAVNEPLAFITFVAAYPLQSEVQGEVVSFTSHGAMVDVDLPGGGLLHCYIPLTAMGDPPPAKARQVLARGERRTFLLVGLDPPRRVAELSLPEVPQPAGAAEADIGAS